MTEGQKALSQFIAFANKHAPNKVDEITSAIKEINKLVDRDVPKKPNSYQKYSRDSDAWGKCPNCHKDVCDYADKYCPNCSQAIDWSE